MSTRPLTSLVCTLFCVVLAACAAPASDADRSRGERSPNGARPLPALEEAVLVWDSHAGRALAFDELLGELASAEVVFVGETHLDDTTHRVEAAILEGLVERRAGQVVLSLEMFERDVQPALDDYLAGRCDEPAFLAAARPWGNYRTAYRPLIECAREHRIPVIAANTPAALRRKVASGGEKALAELSAAERALLPAEILPAEPSYWQRVDRATRGHMNFAAQPDEKRLYSGQNLWDNSMASACAEALDSHPGSTVVHVVGGFHVMYHDGTAAQLRRRVPGARVAVVEILPTSGVHMARPQRDAGRADYLVYAEALARDSSDGKYAVLVPTELRYTLDVPSAARNEERAPLLVWLPGEDERAADARALWRAALGDEAALVVVEPPYSARAEDLALVGSWSQPDTFREDQVRVQNGLERIVEYVTRRLPVAPERVLIAGRGRGATAVLWSALYTEWLAASFLAVAPRGAHGLQLEGLPDLAPVTRELCVLSPSESEGPLRELVADYAALGTPVELSVLESDGEARQVEDAVRHALALSARESAESEPILCVLDRDLPRARQWAEVYARRVAREGGSGVVVSAQELRGDEAAERVHRLRVGATGQWPLTFFSAGQGLPLAAGAFGGTTVLVVPAGTDDAEREAWLELERANALAKRSRFAALRVALADGEPRLAQVLAELHAADTRDALIVPATFCASPEEMQELRRQAGVVAEELELSWLPGLGAELCSELEE